MLDWIYSPYVSLFFSFVNWHEEGTRALFCLKQNIIDRFREEMPESDSGGVSQGTEEEAGDLLCRTGHSPVRNVYPAHPHRHGTSPPARSIAAK
jgi:hypothetical protein